MYVCVYTERERTSGIGRYMRTHIHATTINMWRERERERERDRERERNRERQQQTDI